MSKFGLGRGLADLQKEMGIMPEISVLSGVERVVVRNIPIVAIKPNPNQPRKSFAPQELEELANSIREKGVLQPILIRSITDKNNQYEIIAGERRWRASKMAGLAEIPALVKKLDEIGAAEIALIENVQRTDLNAIEEAVAYENLMEKAGYSHEDISRLIGKSISYLRNILRLSTLPESVKQMVIDGRLSATHARTLAVADNPELLAKKILTENLSVKETENLVKKSKRSDKSRSFSGNSQNLIEIQKFEKQIKKNIGVSTKILIKRNGSGRLVLSFANRAEFEKIIGKLQ